MDFVRPIALTYNLVLGPEVSIEALIAFVQEVICDTEGFEAETWELFAESDLDDSAIHQGSLPQNLAEERSPEVLEKGFAVDGKQGGAYLRKIEPRADDPDYGETHGHRFGWQLTYSVDLFDASEAGCRTAITLMSEVIVQAGHRLGALWGELLRESSGSLGPTPPHADPEVLVQIVQTDEIARAYPDPETYWAQWDEVNYVGQGRAIVSRGLGITDETAFKEMVAERGIALCQTARPGLSEFLRGTLSAEEKAMLQTQESYLDQVGLDPDTHILEFAAYVPEDSYMTARDYKTLLNFTSPRTKKTEGIESVRIAFPDEAMARREFPLLSTLEVEVIYMSDAGVWAPLTS